MLIDLKKRGAIWDDFWDGLVSEKVFPTRNTGPAAVKPSGILGEGKESCCLEVSPWLGKKKSTGQNALWSRSIPRVQGGAPVLRGTRMPADAIVENFDYGVSVVEISDQFEIRQDRIEAILSYAKGHRLAHPVR